MQNKLIFPNKLKSAKFLIEDRQFVYFYMHQSNGIRFYKGKRWGNLVVKQQVISIKEILEKFDLKLKNEFRKI